MADITKLASSFKAWRLTLGTKPHNIKTALEHCEKLGLQPRVCGFQEDRVLFSVTLPHGIFSHPQEFVNQHRDQLQATTFHGTKVELTCPIKETGGAEKKYGIVLSLRDEPRKKNLTIGDNTDSWWEVAITGNEGPGKIGATLVPRHLKFIHQKDARAVEAGQTYEIPA